MKAKVTLCCSGSAIGAEANQLDCRRPQGYLSPSQKDGRSMKKRQRKLSGRMASKGFPNPIDVHVGSRVRQRRTLLGISQTTLAEAMGLTFQQVQKYEKGTNRVSSSRLVDMANALDVSVPYFFEEMSATVQGQTPAMLMDVKKLPTPDDDKDPMVKRETLELVRAYYRITDPTVRKRLTVHSPAVLAVAQKTPSPML